MKRSLSGLTPECKKIVKNEERGRRANDRPNERTNERREEREKTSERIVGKLKMFSLTISILFVVLSNGFSLKPYFQFGFWFSWFKLLLTFITANVHPVQKCGMCCVLYERRIESNVNSAWAFGAVSGIIIWDKLIMRIFVTRLVVMMLKGKAKMRIIQWWY